VADKTIKLTLVGEDKSAGKTLRDLGDESERTGGRLARMGEIAGGVLTADLLKSAGSAIVDFGKASVEAFMGAEQAQRQLEDAYARFPSVTDVSIDALRELNSAIQAKTGADADDLASSQAIMAQYGLTGQQIADLTPLLDDYAVKTGKDLPSAAEDLGKAMLGQGRALKSVGIDFTDAKSVAGNFDQVVAGLRTQVGGFAESESGSAEGALRRLTTEFGDVQEQVGEQLLPVLVQLGEGLLQVIDWVQENSDVLTPLAAIIGTVIGLVTAWNVVQGILNLTLAANPIGIVVLAIAALVAGFIVAYNTSEDFRRIVDGALNWVKQTGQDVANWFVNDLPAFFVSAAEAIGSAFSGVKDFILAPIRDAVTWINGNFVSGINGFLGTLGIDWKLPTIPGFAAGGYTGAGGKYKPAGIVHAGEVVWSQEDVAAHGGPRMVDTMRRSRGAGLHPWQTMLPGYASGGIVANATQGLAGYDPSALAAIQAWAAATGKRWSMTGAGGARTYEQQWALHRNYLAGGNLAADPRKGLGPHMVPAIAMDLSPRPGEDSAAKALLARFGLGLTVAGEPWHVQFLGGRGGGTTGPIDFGIGAFVEDLLSQMPGIPSPWGDVAKAALAKVPEALVGKVQDFFGSIIGSVSGGGAAASGIKATAQQMAAQRGWTGAEWAALDWIVGKESGWNPAAQNPTSTAFGLFQFLNSTWSSVGATKTSDPTAQIAAGLQYIAQRYGTPSAAWAFHQRNNWYKNGTNHAAPGWAVVGEDGPELINLRGGEQVIPNGGNRSRTIPTVGQQQRMHPDDLRELGAMLDRRPVVVQMDGRVVAESTRRHNRAVR